MAKQLVYFLKIILCWLILFFIYRCFFSVYQFSKLSGNSFRDIFLVFFNGFFLDISTACYFLVFTFFVWSIHLFGKVAWAEKLNFYYHLVLLACFSTLAISNVLIYNIWGTLVNYRALSYLIYPKEALASISIPILILVLLQCILLFLAGRFLFRKIVTPKFPSNNVPFLQKIVVFISIPCALFLGMRGGLQLAPINESAAYFSPTLINNHIAVNPVFYLAKNVVASYKTSHNPYVFMEKEYANNRLKNLAPANDSVTPSVLKQQQPNIIFIVLESYTADLVKALGGEKELSPNLDALIQNGLLFTHIYSSGFRTDQGLISILSGFPAQPNNSIIKIPAKASKLPSITKDLSQKGYESSFYYGGEIEFANMNSYLISSGFQNITSLNDFDKNLTNSKWGVHDQYVFERQANDLNKVKEPFFSVLLTLSNHEPFEVPGEKHLKGNDEATNFRNTAYYTDQCIGNYFASIRNAPWFKNTLFVIMADHGHRLPNFADMNYPKSKHIPLLFYGEVLKDEYKGKQVDVIGGQHDLVATIMGQLNMNHEKFKWSKDLLAKNVKEFAYYSNENVLGWIVPKQEFVFTFVNQQVNSSGNDSALIDGKAYLQSLYQEFIDY